MQPLSSQPSDITKLRTTQERLALHRDRSGNLWFLGWDKAPMIYRHNGTETVSWQLPSGTYLSQHDAFAAAPDGSVFFGGSGAVVYTIAGDTLSRLPSPELTGPGAEHRHPYAMACTAGGLYATFANTESRTRLHRFRDNSWTLLAPTFGNISQLAAFGDRLVARELFAELHALDEDGVSQSILVDKASSSTSKVITGLSHLLVYGGRKLVLRDAKGAQKNEVVSAEPVDCVGHVGEDTFLVVDEKGAVCSLDASDAEASLVPQPYKKSLKAVTRIEVDPAGQTWFRRTAARKAYFTVGKPGGKLITIKNK